ncbi:unnamed protein product [Blepharisma stoltei]|uniref:Phosphoglycerate kinase n=1 Tax=Blepharisma stoltei TaxID=1481888 RepID=A0AAU9J6W1_9CILI|nr:unnamed protein product [Blepharisma stoltei]
MLARKLRLDHILDQIPGRRVLIRADFNVPLKNGKVSDTTRIVATLPTINKVLEHNPKSVVLMSHLGRPDGLVEAKSSLRPVAAELETLLGRPVTFLTDCVGDDVVKACSDPAPGSIILLENLRFHPEEEGTGKDAAGNKVKPSKEAVEAFRDTLTSLGDIFINDAFGTAHRAHSSMAGIKLPVRAAGLLMGKELEYFSRALENPERPLLVIMGGAKVKDKIQLITNLLNLCDEMIIGGGMAFTFKKRLENMEIGNSIFDAEGAEIVESIMKKAEEKGVQIHLPSDFVCGDKFQEGCNVQTTAGSVPEGWIGMDIGPESAERMAEAIRRAKTIVWNGPPGVFENPAFRAGSVRFFQEIIEGTANRGLVSIVGGGDTAAFVQSMGADAARISHISTGGGASLELMEGKELPGALFLSDIQA